MHCFTYLLTAFVCCSITTVATDDGVNHSHDYGQQDCVDRDMESDHECVDDQRADPDYQCLVENNLSESGSDSGAAESVSIAEELQMMTEDNVMCISSDSDSDIAFTTYPDDTDEKQDVVKHGTVEQKKLIPCGEVTEVGSCSHVYVSHMFGIYRGVSFTFSSTRFSQLLG